MRRPGSGTGEVYGEPLTMKAECEGEEYERATANENPNKRSQKERTEEHGRGVEKERMTSNAARERRTPPHGREAAERT